MYGAPDALALWEMVEKDANADWEYRTFCATFAVKPGLLSKSGKSVTTVRQFSFGTRSSLRVAFCPLS
jgi:hypothetical protein